MVEVFPKSHASEAFSACFSQYIYWASVMVYLVSTLGKWLFTTQTVLRFIRRINRKWGIKISGVHELSTSGAEKGLPTAVGSHASCSPGNTHINGKEQWEGVYRGSVHGWWERPKWKGSLVMSQWELGDEQEGGCPPRGQGRGALPLGVLCLFTIVYGLAYVPKNGNLGRAIAHMQADRDFFSLPQVSLPRPPSSSSVQWWCPLPLSW